MRNAIDHVLGLPAAMASRLMSSAKHRPVLRITAVVAVVGLLTIAALDLTPDPTTASKTPPADPHAAARSAATVETGVPLDQPVFVDFSDPMDPASVAAATTIRPAVPLKASWSNEGRTLRLDPRGAWNPGQFYTITVAASAASAAGTSLAAPVQVIFVTQARPAAQLAVTRAVGPAAHPSTSIAIRLTDAVPAASVAKAFSVEPATYGTLTASAEPGESGASRYTWTPSAPLEPGRTYVFRLAASVADARGVAIDAPVRLEVVVADRPGVVRSQPATAGSKVDRDQTISLRFSTSMDRRVTKGAVRVSGLDLRKAARISWLDGGRVMVIDPDADFAYGKKVTVTILGSAQSVAGVTLSDEPDAAAYTTTFTVKPKPAVRQAASADRSRPKTTKNPRPPSSGGGGGAAWLSVEKYYLKLLNCTRTGGWVQADGSCKGYGSGSYSAYRKPLSLSSGISSKVSRPYAKLMANRNACDHFLDGDPGDRLRRAGYKNWTWGENIGCRSGNPYDAVLASHRYFQSEQDSGGGHWKNIKNPDYSTVGIGVWKADGNVRLVIDFYHP